MRGANATMLVGEIARRVGVNPKTVRYYESIGLLPEPHRSSANYRVYAEEDVERLRLITSARTLGFAIDEITEILAFKERNETPCEFVLERLTVKWDEIQRHIEGLKHLQSELERLISRSKELRGAGVYCGLIEHVAKGDNLARQ